MHALRRIAGCSAAAWALIACMPEIDRVAEVDTVRVLAVQKTTERDGQSVGAAYARPGETVDFHMLWDRGLIEQPVERMWIKGCVNPDGDSYIGCLPLFEQAAGNLQEFRDQYVVPLGAETRPSASDTISVQMPPAEMLRRPENEDELPYALYMVFFAACAGDLDLSRENVSLTEGRLPITCQRDGRTLDADEFVVGYTSVYVYEDRLNTNPFIGAVQFDETVKTSGADTCVGTECFDPVEPSEADAEFFCGQNPGFVSARAPTMATSRNALC
ncbi:MAG TPA: hypothetical protein VK524_21855, partial [Polyangiaceae bacterium]|nr:hypothetical protein [Polyangiaceae bacterium]